MTPKPPNPLYHLLTNFLTLQTNLPNYKAGHQSLDHAFPPSRDVVTPHLHALTTAADADIEIGKRQELGVGGDGGVSVGGGECIALAAEWTLRDFQIITVPHPPHPPPTTTAATKKAATPRHHPHQKPPQQEQGKKEKEEEEEEEEGESISFTFEDSLDRSTTCSGMQLVGSPFALFAPCEDEAVSFHWDGTGTGTGTGGEVLVRESVACSPTNGIQTASAKVALSCSDNRGGSDCVSKKKEITLEPVLE